MRQRITTFRGRPRTPDYFQGYREGHADGYAGLSPRPPVVQSAGYSDGYARGHEAGAATRLYHLAHTPNRPVPTTEISPARPHSDCPRCHLATCPTPGDCDPRELYR